MRDRESDCVFLCVFGLVSHNSGHAFAILNYVSPPCLLSNHVSRVPPLNPKNCYFVLNILKFKTEKFKKKKKTKGHHPNLIELPQSLCKSP